MNFGSRLFSGAIIISSICNVTVASAMETTSKKTDDPVSSSSFSSLRGHPSGKMHKRCSLCKPVTDKFLSVAAWTQYQYNKRFNPKKNESLLPTTAPARSQDLEMALSTVPGSSNSRRGGPYVFSPPLGTDSPTALSEAENPSAARGSQREIGVFNGFDGSSGVGDDFLGGSSSASAGDGEEENSIHRRRESGSFSPLLMSSTGNNSPVPCTLGVQDANTVVHFSYLDQPVLSVGAGSSAQQQPALAVATSAMGPVSTTAASRPSGSGSGNSVGTKTNLENMFDQFDALLASSPPGSGSSAPVQAGMSGVGPSRNDKIAHGQKLLQQFRSTQPSQGSSAAPSVRSSSTSTSASSSSLVSSSVLKPFQPTLLLPSWQQQLEQ